VGRDCSSEGRVWCCAGVKGEYGAVRGNHRLYSQLSLERKKSINYFLVS